MQPWKSREEKKAHGEANLKPFLSPRLVGKGQQAMMFSSPVPSDKLFLLYRMLSPSLVSLGNSSSALPIPQ